MTDQEINIAIAEFCGWYKLDDRFWAPTGWVYGKDSYGKLKEAEQFNYCTDLNAMHEAEKLLTDTQGGEYDMCLWIVIKRDKTRPASWYATARQRAEAMTRVIGRWKE